PSDLRQEQRDALVDQLEWWYSRDASAAIHGAAGWLLRKWGESALVKRVDETPSSYHPSREWFTLAIQAGRQRFFQTYIVIPAGEYDIGSPEHEPARKSDEARHRVRIPQAFAILDREITRAEVEAFDPAFRTWHVSHAPTPQHAFAGPNWYESVRFCRWMTQRADLTEDDQAYSDPDELNRRGYEREASRLSSHNPRHWPVDLTKPGFRLPIEAEWEVAARAGTNTPYSFGADVGLLHHYGWYGDRGGQRAQLPKQLRPNAWGLFDTMGNLGELCHDCYDVYRLGLTFPAPPGLATGESGSHRLFRGGNWTTPASSCRTAWRLGLFPHGRHTMVGIRLAFTLTQR
ncbi:MAG: formylglycine-generating enzyme family protein, partial [Pirellulaceae bacterium]